jgi:hypothetical protein
MADSISDLLISTLTFVPVSRIRRNHGLEHATLHVLAERFPRLPFAGHSDLGGFWIVGDVSTEDLSAAVREALRRLQNGEQMLAVHPNCGTNFVTSGVMAGGAASLVMLGGGRRVRDNLERVPLAIMLATLALIIAQPLGLLFQARLTTSGEPEGLEILEIIPTRRGRLAAHRVVTVG